MMLCASACFEATGPLSAVAAEVTPKATTTTQTNAGMWLILRLMPDSPSGDKTPLSCSLRERHKGRRVTAFPDVCKAKDKPKMTHTRLSAGWYKLPGFCRFCVRVSHSCGLTSTTHSCS